MIEIFNKYIFLLFFWIWGLIQFCRLQLRNPKGFTELPPNLHPYPHPQSPHPGYKCWKGDWEVERAREAGGSDHSILLLSVLSVCTGKKKSLERMISMVCSNLNILCSVLPVNCWDDCSTAILSEQRFPQSYTQDDALDSWQSGKCFDRFPMWELSWYHSA